MERQREREVRIARTLYCSITACMHCVIIILYRWYLAEFDIDTFEMSDDKLKACRREISELGDDKSHRWPVEFSGGRRKEIEVCQLLILVMI